MPQASSGGEAALPAPLILASTSRWRAELLSRLGLPFSQEDPGIDEAPWKDRGLPARRLVVALARAKAQAVARRRPGALVLGADQVASIDGRILGKPGSAEAAVEQLLLLQGRTHELVTGLALCQGRRVRTALDVHRATMRQLDRARIERYVAREDVTGCAGAYKVEGLGIALFSKLCGRDFSAVIGLPLTRVVELLSRVGRDPLG